jgi:hypothetical protein
VVIKVIGLEETAESVRPHKQHVRRNNKMEKDSVFLKGGRINIFWDKLKPKFHS